MSKIDKAGSYELSMDEYHSDCCDAPSLSASGLHKINEECPAIFWETSYLNPNRVEEKTTQSLDIGRAAHALVLGEPEFNRFFVISPYDDFRTKEAREWRNGEVRTVIKAEQFEAIKTMADAQRRAPQVCRAFEKGVPERSYIVKDADTGFYIKTRPDWTPEKIAQGFLLDYKTARSIHPRKLASDAFGYGYHIQAAMQFDIVKEVTGEKPIGVAHVVQEKSAPYLAELKMFTPEQLDFGRREYKRALRTFAACWERHLAGKAPRIAWPGFTVNAEYFETPRWIAAAMENDADGIANLGNKYGYTASDYFAAG